jgi:hypothetical protein
MFEFGVTQHRGPHHHYGEKRALHEIARSHGDRLTANRPCCNGKGQT